jgi:hypothetical protein
MSNFHEILEKQLREGFYSLLKASLSQMRGVRLPWGGRLELVRAAVRTATVTAGGSSCYLGNKLLQHDLKQPWFYYGT